MLHHLGEGNSAIRPFHKITPVPVFHVLARDFECLGRKRPAFSNHLLGCDFISAAMGQSGARTNCGASRQRRPVRVAGAQHDLLRVKTEHPGDQLRKYGLMTLPAWTRHTVESDLVV